MFNIATTIAEIVQHVSEFEPKNISLMESEGLGVPLLLAYDQLLSNRDHTETLQRSLKTINLILENNNVNYDLGTGLAGVAWLLNHLNELGVIDGDFKDFLKQSDDHIFELTKNDLRENNHDFLYGGLGGVLYFLERINNSDFAEKKLCILAEDLYRTTKSSNLGNYWISEHWRGDLGRTPTINYGLAHGIASKIAILSQLYKHKIKPIITRETLKRSLDYLYSIRIQDIQNQVKCNERYFGHSLYAWCNGDIGIYFSMLLGAIELGDKEMKREIIQFIKEIELSNHNMINSYLPDGGICHGAAGPGMIYKKLYYLTGEDFFNQQAKLWIDQLFHFEDYWPSKGTFYRRGVNSGVADWIQDDGLVTGLAGVCLVKMSFESEKELNWSKCLLMFD